MKSIDSQHYNATQEGVTIPELITPDMGIHRVQLRGDVRFKLWHEQDGRKRYLTLPAGTTIEQARARRDALYADLRKHGARTRTPKDVNPRKDSPAAPSWGLGKYIYRRKPFVARIRGKQIGEFTTEQEAQQAVNGWFNKNAKHIRDDG